MKNPVSPRNELNMALYWCHKIPNRSWKYAVTLLLVFFFASCSSMPFSDKNELTAWGTELKTSKTASVEGPAPEPGDIKTIDDVEFIYAVEPEVHVFPL